MVKEQFFNIEHIPFKAYAYGTDHTFADPGHPDAA